jgi:TolB-like protein/class 3 adenylate cyclase/Flp pilus assembly protein TadD
MTEARVQRRLAAILSADVVGYSRLMGIDEAGTLTRLKAMRRELVDPQIAIHSGRMVKLMGDGALVEFASAVDAVTCAIEIQKRVKEHNTDIAAEERIEFRIGINVGDIIVDADDIYGDGVNVAARIQALADPGGIYVSRSAADQVRDKVPIKIETRGEQSVKNIARPIEVFCIVADDHVPIAITVSSAKPTVIQPPSDKPSIAVLAFNNMSGDAEQEYFSDGISEDIITDLSKLPGLHVIARNSSFAYKKQAASLPDVARDLGVRYLLEGSVRKAGNRVRVTAQLIDSVTGGHIWAERYDRDLTDIFAVQDELTREIISALKVKLTPEQSDRLVRKSTIEPEMYSLFLRAREQMLLHTKAGNVETRNLLGGVIAKYPDFAAAHACMAFAYGNDAANGWSENTEQAAAFALEIAERAVALDDNEDQAHFALAVILLWHRQHDRALAEAERCIALSPNFAHAHLAKAHILAYMGDGHRAIETLDAYRQLDPRYPAIALYFLAEAQTLLGRYEDAMASLRERLTQDPNSETSHALLASCYGHLGRFDEARAAWSEVMRLAPHFSIEHRRRVLPFKDPAIFEHRVDGLRKAGIPV